MQPLLKHRYQILQVLSDVGGFGQTFLAEDTDMPSRRRCVIKKLKPIANPDDFKFVQERFEREAAILERLGELSAQIPKLYAYFLENQELYLVQELIVGMTLRQKVQREGALSEGVVKDLLISLLNVLIYVHEQKIIHRDIKPDNIILRQRDNKPVLIDFGIVKEVLRVDADGNPTSSVMVGTPGYISLEQAIGRPVFASDLYSLGLTAIFLLTKKNPQQMIDPVTGIHWRQYVPKVSSDFAAVLDKATESHASKRYQTTREMLQALQSHVYANEPTYIIETKTVVRPSSPEIKLIPYSNSKSGKWGFCDENKNIVIPFKYDDVELFKEGLARVKLNEKYGFIDETGREITPFKYYMADANFREGVAQVIVNQDKDGYKLKVGYIDKTGKEIIPLKYRYPPYIYFSEGLVKMQLNDKWGFVDNTGKIVVPFKYDNAELFSEGLAAVELNGKWGFINKKGEEIIPFKFYAASSFSEGLANVLKDSDSGKRWSLIGKGKQWGFIDKKGEEIIPFDRDYKAKVYNNAVFNDGLACIQREDKFGFIDRAGELVIPFKHYSEVSPFIKGQDVAYVRIEHGYDDKHGFIDKMGYETVEIRYKASHGSSIFEVVGGVVIAGKSMFHDGLARVNLNNKWGFIDRTDYEVIPFIYGEAEPFSEGLACVAPDKYRRYGYIDPTGKEVIPFKYGSARSFHRGLALVHLENNSFYIDKNGTEYYES